MDNAEQCRNVGRDREGGGEGGVTREGKMAKEVFSHQAPVEEGYPRARYASPLTTAEMEHK